MSLSFAEFKVEFLRVRRQYPIKNHRIPERQGKNRISLVKEIGASIQYIHSLKLLKSTGIVKSRNEGKYVYYSLRDDTIYEF